MKHPKDSYDANKRNDLINKVLPYYTAFLKCKNIGLVYVYVDTGVRLTLQHYGSNNKKRASLNYSIEELEFEQNTRNCLKLAVRQAKVALSNDPTFDPLKAPKFQFIGLPHLTGLIHSLYESNRQLLNDLAGPNGNFTYDSPKFIEAVIRIKHGDHRPILRFDSDVETNEDDINIILDWIKRTPNGAYAFFSGGYGIKGNLIDPVNDYAIRLHWLVDIDVYNTGQNNNDQRMKADSLTKEGEKFLRDIGEIGATQVPTLATRRTQQVISGAGLYMTQRTILKLPPFMSFLNLTLWVDDHLKRRLHEALGDLTSADPEHLQNVLFKQDRHPHGIKPMTNRKTIKEIEDYFDRILRGCIFHALIMKPDGTKGPLSSEIENVIPPRKPRINEKSIEKRLRIEAMKTMSSVFSIWKKEDYYNSLRFNKWANKAIRKQNIIVDSLIRDAIAYIRLVSRWSLFQGAITNLQDYQAYWLYRGI